jgi:hypothetical protein
MNLIFEPYLRHFVIFFQCLLDHKFCLKQSKCSIAQNSIEYLGHIVLVDSVGPDPAKINAMITWPAPPM